mmetsp:Transcript_37059/g.90071  ORF Transcript_37059/g.90071 Transcript_37059/m.90071 type:complete len:251 (+) Transcript_37059:970-1722(+)
MRVAPASSNALCRSLLAPSLANSAVATCLVHTETPVTTTSQTVALSVAAIRSRSMLFVFIATKALATHFEPCEFCAMFLAGIDTFWNRQETLVGCMLIFHGTVLCIFPATHMVVGRCSSGRRSIVIAIPFLIGGIYTQGKRSTTLFSATSHATIVGSANGIIGVSTKAFGRKLEASKIITKLAAGIDTVAYRHGTRLLMKILHRPCFIVAKTPFVLLLEQLTTIGLFCYFAQRQVDSSCKTSSQGDKGKG